MPFTVTEFGDLIHILEQQPEWRTQLRQLVLTEELLALPQIVRELAEAQRRTEERLEALASQVAALAEAQRRTVEELAALRVDTERRFQDLASRFEGLLTKVLTLVDAQERLVNAVAILADAQRKTDDDLANLKGMDLERRYRERAYSYFGPIMRRIRSLSSNEIADLLDRAVEQGHLSRAEADDLALADVVVRGHLPEDQREACLVVEVSWGIGHGDVDRAIRRAALLAKTGLPAIPVVAGSWAPPEVEKHARASRVWSVTDGRVVAPEAAA